MVDKYYEAAKVEKMGFALFSVMMHWSDVFTTYSHKAMILDEQQYQKLLTGPYISDNMRKTIDYFPVDINDKYYPHEHEVKFKQKSEQSNGVEFNKPRNSSWRDTDFFKRMTFLQDSESSTSSDDSSGSF